MNIIDSRRFFQQEGFSYLNRVFPDFLMDLTGTENVPLHLAAGLVWRQSEKGDICLDLVPYAGRTLSGHSRGLSFKLQTPAIEPWTVTLLDSGVVGKPGEKAPLILDPRYGRLYLERYWRYERQLAEALRNLIARPLQGLDAVWLEAALDRLFPSANAEERQQRLAARTALSQRFCVITGGPGTGKTSTVVKIIRLLLEQTSTSPPSIALTAPTGKAAARLKNAVYDGLPQPAHELARPLPASTRLPLVTGT